MLLRSPRQPAPAHYGEREWLLPQLIGLFGKIGFSSNVHGKIEFTDELQISKNPSRSKPARAAQ
jgi:hypothetical protein